MHSLLASIVFEISCVLFVVGWYKQQLKQQTNNKQHTVYFENTGIIAARTFVVVAVVVAVAFIVAIMNAIMIASTSCSQSCSHCGYCCCYTQYLQDCGHIS